MNRNKDIETEREIETTFIKNYLLPKVQKGFL